MEQLEHLNIKINGKIKYFLEEEELTIWQNLSTEEKEKIQKDCAKNIRNIIKESLKGGKGSYIKVQLQ